MHWNSVLVVTDLGHPIINQAEYATLLSRPNAGITALNHHGALLQAILITEMKFVSLWSVRTSLDYLLISLS